MTKTILITGATDGIGLLTAKKLADQGHSLILHGRSAQKLAAAQDDVGGDTTTVQADLSSLSDVATMAKDLRARVSQLDVLINNAGVLKAPTPVLPDGQDIRFVVNTLAPVLLTQALLPLVPKNGRIVNLSSAAQAPVDLKALRGGVRLADMEAYSQSKRAITLWSAGLAQRLAKGPMVVSVNPGSLLATKMVKEGFGIAGNDLSIGADILCRLALDPAHAGDTGRYWDNDAGRFAQVDLAQMPALMAALDDLTAPHGN